MLVDLCLAGRKILVIGGGTSAERKVRKLIAETNNVTVASIEHTPGLLKLGREERVRLLSFNVETNDDINRLIADSDIVIAATDDQALNERIASRAREADVLVCAVDNPARSDLRFPAITERGGVQIAIYTGGKSPAMARVLQQKIGRVVTKQDILRVQLLDYARGLAKTRTKDRHQRRRAMYKIIRNKKISSLLSKGAITKAKTLAREIVERK